VPLARIDWKGATMTERALGRSGLRVSALALGRMGMSEFCDPKEMNDEESVRVIHRFLDAGGNFLDTADVYGMRRNEALVGKAIRDRRDKVVLGTKFANVRAAKLNPRVFARGVRRVSYTGACDFSGLSQAAGQVRTVGVPAHGQRRRRKLHFL